jgi:hypothetical protein
MKKHAVTLTISLTIILCASLLGTAAGQTYTPGVKAGNIFKYQYDLSANVNGSQQTSIPTPFDALVEQAKTIDWIQMAISNVYGSTVTAQMTTQYKSGSPQTFTGTSDVATGQGELAQFLIAANLTANSPLHAGSNQKINGTTTQTFTSGITRELTYQNITTETVIPPEQLSRYNITVPLTQVTTQAAYWDQQTGVLTQLAYRMQSTSTQVNATLTLSLNLVESNVFAVPEYPTLLVTLLVIIIPAVATIKYRKTIKK